MNSKNILIFLNTPYHVETALSIYESLKRQNHIPYVLIDFQQEGEDDGFGLIDFFQKYNLNYLTPSQFDENLDTNFFHKMFVVSATRHHNHNTGILIPEVFPPHNYNHRMQIYKDKAVLIYHHSNFSDYLEYNHYFFTNPISLSVSPFSQRYGLEYIFQIENPIAKNKLHFSEKDCLNFVFLGRFYLENRHIELLKTLPNLDKQIRKKIKIDFLGQKPEANTPIFSLLNSQNLKNIKYEFHFNVDQISLYEKIYNADYFLNLLILIDGSYIKDRFTSNLNHIIAFSKPNISPALINLIYNIPGFNYIKDFEKVFLETVNLSEEKYKEIVLNFNTVKTNMRNHNNSILKRILN
jgi:hypothetical protein